MLLKRRGIQVLRSAVANYLSPSYLTITVGEYVLSDFVTDALEHQKLTSGRLKIQHRQ